MNSPAASVSSTRMSAPSSCATSAAMRSLSPKRISSSATASFSLTIGTTPSSSSRSSVDRAWRYCRRTVKSSGASSTCPATSVAELGQHLVVDLHQPGLADRRHRLQRAGVAGPAAGPTSRAPGARRRSRPTTPAPPGARPRGARRSRRRPWRPRRGRCSPSSSVIDDVPTLTTTARITRLTPWPIASSSKRNCSSPSYVELEARRCAPRRPCGAPARASARSTPERRRAARWATASASRLVRSDNATARTASRPMHLERRAVDAPFHPEALGHGPVHDVGLGLGLARRASSTAVAQLADEPGDARPGDGRDDQQVRRIVGSRRATRGSSTCGTRSDRERMRTRPFEQLGAVVGQLALEQALLLGSGVDAVGDGQVEHHAAAPGPARCGGGTGGRALCPRPRPRSARGCRRPPSRTRSSSVEPDHARGSARGW